MEQTSNSSYTIILFWNGGIIHYSEVHTNRQLVDNRPRERVGRSSIWRAAPTTTSPVELKLGKKNIILTSKLKTASCYIVLHLLKRGEVEADKSKA